jgi:hypothetical protein
MALQHLLNVLVQIANKVGNEKKKFRVEKSDERRKVLDGNWLT